ncbi:hypothetical protein [Planctomicrobium piriforme]|uniref:Uncharacterized protein n=1 Tax=Planctomicrobium piriforme TaxID=1576369 RepID=A0A1I3PF25_9PLAN|nr:hypothetical protein [Planctomicrobium piriforme]SFJ19929.1 hypothetical protein SAMN05421753_116129 [Planctomicrobium piriforme]
MKSPEDEFINYRGTVSEFDADVLHLKDSVYTSRTVHQVPVFGRLPWINRWFRATGATRISKGNFSIRMSDIEQLTITEGPPVVAPSPPDLLKDMSPPESGNAPFKVFNSVE